MKTGFYNWSDAEYHRDPAPAPSLSSSIAKVLLDQTPRHAWCAHPRLNPDFRPTSSDRFDLGTALHRYILQGDTSFVVVDEKDWRKDAAKAAKADARAAGAVPLLTHQMDQVERVVHAVFDDLRDWDLSVPKEAWPLDEGSPEVGILWQEPNGIWCRSKLDWLHHDRLIIDDLKTTEGSAGPLAFQRQIFSLGYDIQAAFYLRGLKTVCGKDAAFRFVVVEVNPPYGVSVQALDPAAMALADQKVERAIERWARCLEANEWPGYSRDVFYHEPPGWDMARWETMEALRDEL